MGVNGRDPFGLKRSKWNIFGRAWDWAEKEQKTAWAARMSRVNQNSGNGNFTPAFNKAYMKNHKAMRNATVIATAPLYLGPLAVKLAPAVGYGYIGTGAYGSAVASTTSGKILLSGVGAYVATNMGQNIIENPQLMTEMVAEGASTYGMSPKVGRIMKMRNPFKGFMGTISKLKNFSLMRGVQRSPLGKALNISMVNPLNGIPLSSEIDEVSSIVSKFKGTSLDCDRCANEVLKYANSKGIATKRIAFDTSSELLERAVTAKGDIISMSGYHEGVMINGKVYDPSFPNGISYDNWLDSFNVYIHELRINKSLKSLINEGEFKLVEPYEFDGI